jgi:hypothetical protein
VFQTLRILLCALLLVGAAGAMTSAATKILGTADGEKSGTRLDVTQLKRVSGNMVSLKFVLVNDSSAALNVGDDYQGPESSPSGIGRDAFAFSGVTLEDASASTKYTVVRDTDGNCLCSTNVQSIPAKSSVNLWAKFTAPPDSVTKLNVVLPHFQPVEDVPLTPLPK